MYCKACGEKLGNPVEDLHDPKGLSGIVEEGVENPDSAHLKVVDGDKGMRYQCAHTGQMTKLLEKPPSENKEGSGDSSEDKGQSKGRDGGSPSQTAPSNKGRSAQEVYDLKKDTNPMEILHEVVSSEVYGLNDDQINEVMSWGDIYDEQVPPNDLEDILSNLKGVSKQQSSLMAQKYEGKLNKWVRQQSDDPRGPRIGAAAGAQGGRGGPGGPSPQRRPQPKKPQQGGRETQPKEGSRGAEEENIRDTRRKHRIKRRNEVVDEAAEKFASRAAENMAQDFGTFFGDAREVLSTAFKKKAEKDPEWFFEKAEEWDMDILDTIMEPSEQRKKEMQEDVGEGPSMAAVDEEAMSAVEDIESSNSGGDEHHQRDIDREPERPPDPEERSSEEDPYAGARDSEVEQSEEVNSDAPIDNNKSPMEATPEIEEDEEEENLFDEVMGDVAEE